MMGNRLRLLCFFVLLVATVAGLHAAGAGALAAPPSLAGLRQWVETRDPVIAGFALVRLLALALGYYLLSVTVAGTAFRLARTARLVAATDLLTVPAVRRVLDGCIGLAIVVAVSAPSGTAWAVDQAPPAPAPVMHWLGPARPEASTPTVPAAALAIPAAAPAAPAEPATWTIRKGDHLWGVAHATLAAARGRAVTDAEVAVYWRRVVEINRTRLKDPQNADLIFAGQKILLPPMSPLP
jgi:hypothetical protein